MVSATNVDATAVNTIQWLARPSTTIVVPVYQRQYRWDIGGCEQLLGDIRAVADSDDRHRHFIGSILSTTNSDDDSGELVLIDGQQRITTLMLLVAALHHTALQDDVLRDELQRDDARTDLAGPGRHPTLASELAQVLVRATDKNSTKLRPHRAWAEVFESVVLNRRGPGDELRDSRFDDNYAFFRSQVLPHEVARIWRGLQKLEHVAITLGADANAQQIFESLNSTGEPLRDHELIHNYVLMGLSHAEQSEIEDTFWVPIEQNTGESIASFWRHYLVMTTGREVAVAGERGVYDAFRQRFPRLDLDTLRAQAAEWREFSAVFRTLLEPSREPDPELARQLGYLNTFGRGMYPLAMQAYHEYSRGSLDRDALVDTLEQIQSLVLRRTIVGVGADRLVARLCRAREGGNENLRRAIARITPSDERVRVALKFSDLPHPGYVLGRIARARAAGAAGVMVGAAQGTRGASGLDTLADPDTLAGLDTLADPDTLADFNTLAGLDVENIFPLAPSDAWSGDGLTEWRDYSDDQQNSHRALAQTLGNLALLEQPLAERAVDLSFPVKRELYASSAVPTTSELQQVTAWGTAAIARRTVELTDIFLTVWKRSSGIGIDDDGLTPILDAQRRRGWPRGWEREFEYVEYRGEHWEVYDVKYLFNRIFKRLWADARPSVVAFSAQRGGPLYDSPAWNGHWDALDESHYLYMGWDSKYMLTALQGVLDEAGLSAEVFVKYSYVGVLM